jgi:murein DD-endopeptidase MepM/ murein hydrolase activator NlpD
MGRLLLLIIALILAGCRVSKDPQRPYVKELQKGNITEDTSFVYRLPYEECKSHLIVQGYFGSFSHKNRIALDFKMKKGTKILAARDGVIVRLEEKNNKGAWNKKYRPYANLLVVQHADGTRAGYWHLQQNGVL